MNPSTEPVVLVVPAAGFPGAPFLAIVTRLQDAGVPFVAASENPGICYSNDGVRVTASRHFQDRTLCELPALVVLGDAGNWLGRSVALRALLAKAIERERIVGAVGHGLWPLLEAGFLRGRSVAANPELDRALAQAGAFRLESPCVVAGRLVTATEAGAGVLAEELLTMTGVRPLPIELR